MKLIATLTTLPSRIAFLEPVLASILNQSHPPDEIHLQLPRHCVKEDSLYVLPDFLSSYPQIRVFEQEKDHGPATKWLPALDHLHGEEVLLLIMDDDCHYTSEMVAKLQAQYRKAPGQVYCSTGGVLKGKKIRQFTVREKPQPNALTVLTNNNYTIDVDTVQGFSLILFDPNVISRSLIDSLKEASLTNLADDIVLSAAFEKEGIKRKQIAPYQVPQPLDHAEINPIHGEGRLTRMSMKAFNWAQEHLAVWEEYQFIEDYQPTFIDRLKHRVAAIFR
jgi:hypothetical protein